MTGGAGAVGERTIAALRAAGKRVRCLVHARPVGGADEVVVGDLRDGDGLKALVAGAAAVVHLAAATHARDPAAYRELNVHGTERLLRAAESAGVGRFVHVSTHAIAPEGGAYSRSKVDAEAIVAASTLETIVVRLPEVVGAASREGLEALVDAARRGRPLLVVGAGRHEVRPVHVDDVAAALAAAVDAPAAAGRTYTLAGERLSLRAFAEAARDASGARSRIVGVPEPLVALLCGAARVVPLPVVPDQLARLRAPRPAPSADAERDLGFRPRGLAAILAGVGERA